MPAADALLQQWPQHGGEQALGREIHEHHGQRDHRELRHLPNEREIASIACEQIEQTCNADRRRGRNSSRLTRIIQDTLGRTLDDFTGAAPCVAATRRLRSSRPDGIVDKRVPARQGRRQLPSRNASGASVAPVNVTIPKSSWRASSAPPTGFQRVTRLDAAYRRSADDPGSRARRSHTAHCLDELVFVAQPFVFSTRVSSARWRSAVLPPRASPASRTPPRPAMKPNVRARAES